MANINLIFLITKGLLMFLLLYFQYYRLLFVHKHIWLY